MTCTIKCYHVDCHDYLNVMLNVVMLSVIMLSVMLPVWQQKNEANLFCVALSKVTKASKVICPVHRYRKTKIDCLRFVMCPLLVPGFQGFFFPFLMQTLTVLMKQTRQAVCAIKQSITLRCLWSCVAVAYSLKKNFASVKKPLQKTKIKIMICVTWRWNAFLAFSCC